MQVAELEQVIDLGIETRRVEFKSPGMWTDPDLRAKICASAIAMANTRDGGLIVVGMAKDQTRPGYYILGGLDARQAASFVPDDVISAVNSHASPHVRLTVTQHLIRGTSTVVVMEVAQFLDFPAVCVKDILGSSTRKGSRSVIAPTGSLLVRSRRIPETTRVQSPDDLRDLIDIAIDIGMATYFRRRRIEATEASPSDASLFAAELGDLRA